VNVEDLLLSWHRRQEDLLRKLPPAEFREYEELRIAIRVAENALKTAAPVSLPESSLPTPLPLPPLPPPPTTIPLFPNGDKTVAKRNADSEPGSEGEDRCGPKQPRVPLTERRLMLVEFLKKYGPQTRAAILAKTGIPNGSLAALLNKPEFSRDADGRWSLVDVQVATEGERT
jgi:hypothetical protein